MLSERINLSSAERSLSIVAGSALCMLGTYALWRGVSGHCPLYDRLGVASLGGGGPRRRPDLDSRRGERFDRIDESVDLSFPASDPPAHNHFD